MIDCTLRKNNEYIASIFDITDIETDGSNNRLFLYKNNSIKKLFGFKNLIAIIKGQIIKKYEYGEVLIEIE